MVQLILLGFLTLPIIWYYKETTVFLKRDLFPSLVEEKDREYILSWISYKELMSITH
jgi:hypothetical protein